MRRTSLAILACLAMASAVCALTIGAGDPISTSCENRIPPARSPAISVRTAGVVGDVTTPAVAMASDVSGLWMAMEPFSNYATNSAGTPAQMSDSSGNGRGWVSFSDATKPQIASQGLRFARGSPGMYLIPAGGVASYMVPLPMTMFARFYADSPASSYPGYGWCSTAGMTSFFFPQYFENDGGFGWGFYGPSGLAKMYAYAYSAPASTDRYRINGKYIYCTVATDGTYSLGIEGASVVSGTMSPAPTAIAATHFGTFPGSAASNDSGGSYRCFFVWSKVLTVSEIAHVASVP